MSGIVEAPHSVISDVLKGHAALVTADGHIAHGELQHLQPRQITHHPSMLIDRHPEYVSAACPVFGVDHQLWLACEARDGGPAWEDAARAIMHMAAPAVAAWLARNQIATAHNRHHLHTLFTALLQLQHSPHVPEYVSVHAAKAGILLDGWHTGIHITGLYRQASDGTTYAPATIRLSNALAAEDIDAPLFSSADGWSLWLTELMEPSAGQTTTLLSNLGHALAAYNAHTDDQPLVAGVGQPGPGPRAIAPPHWPKLSRQRSSPGRSEQGP